ncbi:MAG: tetratricopeptide repeat protein, partial [Sedimentisphaerales bacterium]|nr:tetratricopeptide repeat protein [Sedimentisphaerales bacterium]
MARRRLNKKVAIIGSLIFAFGVFAAIGAFLYLSRDPEKFIKDGDAALLAGNYEEAALSYNRARVRAKSDSLKIELLFKIADVYSNIDKWNNILGCWNTVIQIDPKNIKARLSRLNYLYIMAKSVAGFAGGGPWQDIASQASELMEVAEADGLLNENTARWEPFGLQQTEMGDSQLGTYLHLLRGRAILETAIAGAVTDPNESLERAINDLEEVRKLQPGNVDTYWLLARVFEARGNIAASRGDLGKKKEAGEQAEKILEQAVELASDNPKTHINLLQIKLARASDSRSKEQMEALEPQYQSLVGRFNTSAEAFSALCRYHQLVGSKNIDKAVEAAERALELDKENVAYAINAAIVNYTEYSTRGQRPNIQRAIEILNSALTRPDAQDKPGPKMWANKSNRITLYSLLAQCYIEQVLDPQRSGVTTESQKQQLISKAEEAVHQIEQLIGSGEDPTVAKWQGMLELAKGDETAAIRKLYATYEQNKAAGRTDPMLVYWLAQIFRKTTEIGAANEFFISALSPPAEIYDTKPEALLDCAEVLLKLRSNASALNAVKFFEDNYGANDRSKVLRIMAYIGGGQFDEAEKELVDAAPDDPNTIKLNWELVWAKSRKLQGAIAQKQARDIIPQPVPATGEQQRLETEGADALTQAELASYYDTLAQLTGKMLSIEPNSVGAGSVAIIFRRYVVEEGKFKEAEEVINKFLKYFPDNVTALSYKQVLAEPQPDKVSPERVYEIEENIRGGLADPVARAVSLGAFYQGNKEPNKAIPEFKKVLETAPAAAEGKMTESQRFAAISLYEVAIQLKDWQLAEQMADIARRENLDGCQGNFYAARIAVGREQWKDAMTKINEALKQKPVFSYAYMFRSVVNAAIGNEYASIEDARKAWSFNPLDGTIAKRLAFVLLERNEKLGGNVTPDQMAETKDALVRALSLNPGDLQLVSFYAEYMSDDEPEQAMAMRQSLQKNSPSMLNTLLLGKMATRIADKEKNAKKKEAYFAVAASAFEQALAMEPQNRDVLTAYSEYYRLSGQSEKAERLLAQSQDERLLWSYHISTGRFKQAKELLEQLYKANPKDTNTVKGLLLVADGTADERGIRKYSEELLLLENNLQNRLFQVQAFLKLGLVKDADQKLQSVKEEYPNEPRVLLLDTWLALRQGQLDKALDLANRCLESDEASAMAWRLRGQINLVKADYSQAISDLKKSKLLLDEPVTGIALARAYLQAGRSEDAITELEATVDHPQAPPESRALLEQVYWQFGRKESLKRFYAQTLEKFPDSVLWLTHAATFAGSQGELDRAEQLYEQALQQSKKDGKPDREALSGYLQTLLLAGRSNKLFREAGKYIDSDVAPLAYFRMAEAK